MLVVLALVLLVVVMVMGVPIPLAFLTSALFIVVLGDFSYMALVPYGVSEMNTVLLLTIPMFILAGSVMEKGNMGKVLIHSIEKRMGNLKGGLGVVTVVACGVFGSLCGSSSATLSCIGSIMAPRLEENGYDRGFAGALLASSGVLGVLIPPSMIMILYGWMSGASILGCFLATLIPGIMLIILFSIVNLAYAKKHPDIKVYNVLEEAAKAKGNKKERSALWAYLMPVLILGTIYGGVLTATEAAALSVLYAIPIGFIVYKGLSFKTFKESLISASISTGAIMAMLFAIMILSRLFIMDNLPNRILESLMSISENRFVILIMVNIFIIIIGMLMDDCSGVVLVTPLLLPVVQEVGVSPIHFAAIVGVNLGMGCITPPTAPLLYLAGRICKAEVRDMLKPTMWLILFCWLPVLILVTYIPALGTFLPTLLGYM